MINSYSKYYSIFLLVLLDFISVIFSVYFSASFIEINFIPYLNLFFYYSCLFFVIVFVVYFYLRNYTYLNRTFGIDNIKSLIYGSILIFLALFTFKNILEFNNIRLYFWDNYFLSTKNISNQVILFCLLSIIIRITVSKVSIRILNIKKNNKDFREYVLYGAGRSGFIFLDSIVNNNYPNPKFIIDDDSAKIGRYIKGIKIISFGEFEKLISKKSLKIKEVIFCIPSIESFKLDKIKKKIINLGVKFVNNQIDINSDNGITEILNDISNKSQNINENINEEIKSFYENKVVLVTGGGGSIGKEICYKICKFNIKKLIIVDIDEYRLSIINRELLYNNQKMKNKYFNYLVDINNFKSIFEIYEEHKPDIVYHAAASKHVDLVENNWFYASKNNIISTFNICESSRLNNVQKTIFISTDKAVDPINFLGLSKAVGEKITKFYSKYNDNTKFSVVRFGNVVGSSGSLLDAIKHQLKISDIINITDKKMTRYFMTISDAANLVLISTKISKNGDCHVLKMGEPVKIIDIISSIVSENSSQIDGINRDIKINVIGMRPGEKLHEKLYDKEKIQQTENKFILNENKPIKNVNIDMKSFLNQLDEPDQDKEMFKNKLLNFINN